MKNEAEIIENIVRLARRALSWTFSRAERDELEQSLMALDAARTQPHTSLETQNCQ
jgi:hypothetical protein